MEVRLGRTPYLSMEEEELIVAWIKECSERGFCKSKEEICKQIKVVLDGAGKTIPAFTDNKPGKKKPGCVSLLNVIQH